MLRLRDVAERVGITERAVQRIVADLEEAGVLTRLRDGRRNQYEVHGELPLRHPVEADCTIGELITLIVTAEKKDSDEAGTARQGSAESICDLWAARELGL